MRARKNVYVSTSVALGCLVLLCGSCGSRTGLLVDSTVVGGAADASTSNDAAADAGTDAGNNVACTPGEFSLVPATPAVMLVLDRSGSMATPFAADGRTRWEVLTSALASALPPVDASMEIGALLFPLQGGGRFETCAVSGSPDLTPATGNVSPLVSLMNQTVPDGATPTADALDTSATSLRSIRAASTARAMVLATDGGPNCNPDLDAQTCVCSDPMLACGDESIQCLDDARTVARIASYASEGLPTYVIGIQDPNETQDLATLNAMAIAGGRPQTNGSTRYFAASSEADLTSAFVDIRNQVGACTYLTTSVPNIDGSLTLTFDGAIVPFDSSKTNGWYWADESNGEIALVGAACTKAAAESSPDLLVSVTCEMDAGTDASDASEGTDSSALDADTTD